MKDAMLDFESFGHTKHACIVQVGACYFDRVTGEIGEVFKANIDARTAVQTGATIDADTVYWWLSQSKEAIASITAQPLLPIADVMRDLNQFLAPAKCIWSHATFDFVLLTEALKRLDIKPAFHYRTARDIRTLTDFARVTIDKQARDGVHHDALDDCKFQVKYCVLALNKLAKKVGE